MVNFIKILKTGYYVYNDVKRNSKYLKIAIYDTEIGWPRVYPISTIINWSFNERETYVTYRSYLNINYDLDHDNDGATIRQEAEMKTDPFNRDTDNDGILDGDDIEGIIIVVTLDGQSPTNINTAATDPLNPDTDNDGVLDGTEVYGLTPYGFITDPNNPDTDGDGVIDGQDPNPFGITDTNGDGIADEWVDLWQNQISQWGYSSSWLTSIENPDADTDGDGISNRDEYENGTVPIVPNGHYETRIITSPIEITANVDEIITAEFSVVDLSYEPSTGEVSQLSAEWAE